MTFIYLILTLLIGGAIALGWRVRQTQNHYQLLQAAPCPPKHWLLGNIPQVSAAIKKKQFFKQLLEWSEQYGPAYIVWSVQPLLILSQPTAIEKTIVNGMRDGSLIRSRQAHRAWNDMCGPILLGSRGPEWKWRRKAWNPEFSTSGLAPFVTDVQPACTQVIAKLKQVAPDEAVQLDPLFVELTMRVISSLLLGIPVTGHIASPERPALEVEKVYQATAVISYRFLRVATGEKIWKKYLPLKSSREYWSAKRYLETFLTPYVEAALQQRDNPSKEQSENSAPSALTQSMLAKIAEKEPRYTRETLLAESVELLVAGTDTTAHSLSFAVGELALNTEVRHKARNIVDTVWDTYGEFSLNSLKDLTYLRAIVKETLRLYSVASGSTSLETTRQSNIEGVTVPPRTKIFWSMLGAGRDADAYPNPTEFRPERWLENHKESPSLPMINFGSGHHRCLGEHLAMLEATIMLAQLLHNFDWELVNGRASLDNLQQNLLIYPVDGMPVRLKARDHHLRKDVV